MTTTVGYTTDDEYQEYATARGYIISGNAIVQLQLALDWLELQPFKGEKTDPSQALEWPRDGNTEIPDKIVQAQLEAALVYNAGGNLMASIGKMVTEKTVGPITTKWSENGPQTIAYPKLSMLLRGYVSTGYGSTQFNVSR
jgi:hypothetical protein